MFYYKVFKIKANQLESQDFWYYPKTDFEYYYENLKK